MLQFIDGTQEQYEDLFQRSRSTCIRFQNVRLPVGCTPSNADIGFEPTADGNGMTLLVKPGVSYQGTQGKCRQWVETGSLPFRSLPEFIDFCQTDLAAWFARDDAPASANGTAGMRPQSDLRAAQDMLDRRRSQRNVLLPDAVQTALAAHVHGQPFALAAVAERVAAHANRSAPRRPATIFFVGPTGVGKTRTAEYLPEVLNEFSSGNDRWQHLRLDMNEYREAHRISQLIGSPQGYVGHGDGAQLTRQLARHPRTVVLFDEIEKAHPDIFLALMNAMDSGRLSSASTINGSNEIDCRKAIFAFTSNLSADAILRDVAALPADPATQAEAVPTICRRHLREQQIPPELIGRISTFAVFKPIDDDARLHIALSGIGAVANEFGLTVSEVAPEALAEIVGEQDARFGARADEYRIDALLGRDFARVAASGQDTVKVLANPLRAVAVADAATPMLEPTH